MLFSFNDTKGNAQVRSNTFGYVFEFFYIGCWENLEGYLGGRKIWANEIVERK